MAKPDYRHAMRRQGAPTPSRALSALRAEEACPECLQPLSICACRDEPAIDNRIELLILQHPQEKKELLATAALTKASFGRAVLRTGLSWRSLGEALGRPAEPQHWAVLYLGSAHAKEITPGAELVLLDGKGKLLPQQEAHLHGIAGVVLLDGSWSQAKTLWWRNAWMLKCRRLLLGPKQPSRYGRLRREPRQDALSSLEAAALALARLESRPEIETAAQQRFQRMLDRYRAAEQAAKTPPAA